MSKMTRIALATLWVAALALAFAPSALAEELAEVVSYEKFVEAYPYEHSVISQAGGLVLLGIEDARVDLEKNQYHRAQREAVKARGLLLLIRAASPAARLDDGLSAARAVVVSDAGGNPDDLVPIYSRLEAYERIDAAADVRTWVDKSKGSLAAGQKEEAVAALEKASASIRYVEIDLPVKETLAKLDRVIRNMKGKDYLAAAADLEGAEKNLKVFAEMASIQVEELAVGTGPVD